MDNIDKTILTCIQEGLDIEKRPFLALAQRINITEDEVIDRIKKLKEEGYIRRLGGIFNSKKLGYVSTLCAIIVPEDKIEYVATIINKYDEITHNYMRNNRYNMWFTIIAPSKERIDQIIREIKKEADILNLISLPSNRLFKVKVTLNLGGTKDARCS
ncbi:DNA-binding Lrp family transcriptional regulator [Clostridium tetanomorphum]|uniref:siroheme decarboxylase n=1 Tax=Clostridium tetanomorphum TaxID=1553 RepID=A0A923E957_CLOTT|nr:AsnC family transcriptional regulator [Clostridium tetanomorphum]KAJ53886.1 transcriptional regulator, AsnC family protein [Clostridium tetanomorphum DSM 665]MBC2397401.1 Lrp/AsnC family transcriptional regulator [Clostridium tetanomorphum]MBP1862621.1 DNA-binding Lrp family transcriptional regulator [Clostridium tetanomorphum]NRS85538.1 DNA-binding Lrp family transcriptional regulator [Clostridium tetanomorphum]NRZ96451.1 DNA-binding Lrp family transcriptional regulator [Clostridium tetano